MRIVIVGATGNVGTSVVRALSDSDEVESVIGLARRLPALVVPSVEWRRADVTSSDLAADTSANCTLDAKRVSTAPPEPPLELCIHVVPI